MTEIRPLCTRVFAGSAVRFVRLVLVWLGRLKGCCSWSALRVLETYAAASACRAESECQLVDGPSALADGMGVWGAVGVADCNGGTCGIFCTAEAVGVRPT